jgi:shikimate kinase
MDSGGRFGSPQAAGWSQGDLNYDGRTNVFDLLGIDTAGTFNTGTIVPAANGLKASGTSFTETAVSAATSTTTLESPAPSRTAVFASFAAGIQWEMVAADGDDDEESASEWRR